MVMNELEMVNEMVNDVFTGINGYKSLDMHIHEMSLTMGMYILDGIIHGIIHGVCNIYDGISYDIYYGDDIIYHGDNINDILDNINKYCITNHNTTIYDMDDDIYNNVYINKYKINDMNNIYVEINITKN